MSETTYTVQMLRVFREERDGDPGVVLPAPVEGWVDIANVTVPRKSPRKRVVGEALRQSGIRPAADAEPLRIRVLDAASAAATKVVPYQPEALWRVS